MPLPDACGIESLVNVLLLAVQEFDFRFILYLIALVVVLLSLSKIILTHKTVSLCTAHNIHAALQSQSAPHTTHTPPYSLTLHCTQHTHRSTVLLCTQHTRRPTVSLCTAHNTHAALQSHSVLHTHTHTHTALQSHSAPHTAHTPLYDMLQHHLICITT